jgi:hypothetical protein
MLLRQATDVLVGLLLAQAPSGSGPGLPVETMSTPAFLQEPHYFVEKEGGRWRVRKPRLRVLEAAESGLPQAWTIFEDQHWTTAEKRKNALPRLRLNRALVKFNPLTGQRTPIEDWTGQADAEEIEADIQAFLIRFALATPRALFSSTPVYMAQLAGASGHTAEESNDPRQFVIYVDPFRATGRLHAASTLVHELSHVERYQRREFHANRAAAVLPKADFILVGAADELAAYEAEAAFLQSFLNNIASEAVRRAVRKAMPSRQLRWPMALTVLLGFEGPSDTTARMKAARKQIVLDLHRQASQYWDIHHEDTLDPTLEASIRNWYSRSREWKDIAEQRADWLEAGAQVLRGGPRADRAVRPSLRESVGETLAVGKSVSARLPLSF